VVHAGEKEPDQFVNKKAEKILFLLRLVTEKLEDKVHGLRADVRQRVDGQSLCRWNVKKPFQLIEGE